MNTCVCGISADPGIKKKRGSGPGLETVEWSGGWGVGHLVPGLTLFTVVSVTCFLTPPAARILH